MSLLVDDDWAGGSLRTMEWVLLIYSEFGAIIEKNHWLFHMGSRVKFAHFLCEIRSWQDGQHMGDICQWNFPTWRILVLFYCHQWLLGQLNHHKDLYLRSYRLPNTWLFISWKKSMLRYNPCLVTRKRCHWISVSIFFYSLTYTITWTRTSIPWKEHCVITLKITK